MSQDRLREVLKAAIEAAESSPDWRDGDELCVILADAADTVLSARGFGTYANLAQCLEYHAGIQRQAAGDSGD